ncbi:MAG: hypothetical protein KAI94_07170 [Anaerolineales bacterium]|nr:hypothetical protein [Anaerolineales bacterium]MCK5429234.1 hypothetical protein [Anaerolineales bacterium]
MNRPSRPLWKLLIVFSEPEQADELTCDECFNVLEHLAGEAVRGLDVQLLQEAVQLHLEHCPDCREHHLHRLGELEAKLFTRR